MDAIVPIIGIAMVTMAKKYMAPMANLLLLCKLKTSVFWSKWYCLLIEFIIFLRYY